MTLLLSVLLFVACHQAEQKTVFLAEVEWQLYKFNLLEGDRICQIIPANDSSLVNKRLYEYNLVVDTDIERMEDDIFYRFFEEGVAPCHSYYYSIKFFGQLKDSVILNYKERGEIITSIHEGEEEFSDYLRALPVSLISPNLTAIAKEKGVIGNR